MAEKKTSKKSEKETIYKPTDQAKERPIRVRLNGSWVAIGAEITINRKPPAEKVTIKEATPKQYEELYKRGSFNHLIKKG